MCNLWSGVKDNVAVLFLMFVACLVHIVSKSVLSGHIFSSHAVHLQNSNAPLQVVFLFRYRGNRGAFFKL